MDNTSSNHQFSLIVDDIYDQKFKLISSKVKKWVQQKNDHLNIKYKKNIDQSFTELKNEHGKFQQRIHQLLKIINSQFQMLNKVRSINNQQNGHKKSQNLKQCALSAEQLQIFQSSLQKSHKKTSDLQQLCQYSSRFFAITSTQLNQFKSFNSSIESRKQRYNYDIKKQHQQQNKYIQQLCLKSQSKYFQLKGFEKLRQSFEKEIKINDSCIQDAKNYINQSLKKRKSILKNCMDNIERFQTIYEKIFCVLLTKQIRLYFQKLILQIEKSIISYEVNEQNVIVEKQNTKKETIRFLVENSDLFLQILEQITIGQWKKIIIDAKIKTSFTSFASLGFSSSHHAMKDQSNYQISHKQLAGMMSTSNNQGSDLKPNLYIMTLTIDYKLLFRKQADSIKISKQYLLNDLKRKSQKQDKKIIDESSLILKDKKTKQSITIKFLDADKRQQFLLHLNRFDDMKNSLKK